MLYNVIQGGTCPQPIGGDKVDVSLLGKLPSRAERFARQEAVVLLCTCRCSPILFHGGHGGACGVYRAVAFSSRAHMTASPQGVLQDKPRLIPLRRYRKATTVTSQRVLPSQVELSVPGSIARRSGSVTTSSDFTVP